MKKIAVITSTRAEYGLLSPVIAELRKYESDEFRAELVVTGTHLSEAYGMTVKEIENDGMRVDHRIIIPLKSDTEADISNDQAEALNKFTDLFQAEKYDAIVILGDRYEMLAIAIAAGNTRTPIFHLCGGDTTEGAMDEWIRHCITKISYLHFTTNEDSRRRVIQLGEDPERVFDFGSPAIDNIKKISDVTKAEALRYIDMEDCRYAVCTYHPVTMEEGSIGDKISSFLEALKSFPELQFIVTKSNSDQGGAVINNMLDSAAEQTDNLHVFTSLGAKRYLSLMRHAEFVLGNSSSGIYETPAFHIPTVNIGDRQRGRLQTASIINCGEDAQDIIEAIRKAMSPEFRESCMDVHNYYGDGDASVKISGKIFEVITEGRIDLKKKFFDLK